MIRLRTGTVRAVERRRPGVQELAVEVEGHEASAVAYPALTGAVQPGDTVLLNTTAVARGLGTGGVHFVIACLEPRDADPPGAGHVLKMRYTPLQAEVETVEQEDSPHREAFTATARLDGLPVVWTPLHSMVGAATAGARAAGAERVAYVMTDGAALPGWFSRQVHALREAGLLEAVITSGQALGGDFEAVNVFSGLLAARSVARADVVVVGDGPGKVGTGTTWGASDVASATALNAAGILGGRPVATLRVNFADPDYRHHGVSPHSVTALTEVALVPVHVAVPALDDDRRSLVWEALKRAHLEERHQLVEVNGRPAVELLRQRGVPAETMGRSLEEEPAFFEAAGAAGMLAGRMAAGTSRWRREAGESS